MMKTRLIHVTAELPPTVGGVADYTTILSRRLVEVSDGAVEPVLVHAGKEKSNAIDVSFPVRDLSGRCSAAALADMIDQLAGDAVGEAVILLEYVGYGYAKRGAPLWLAEALRRVCEELGVPLITMFHEISASGPIWSSAFWLSPIQTWTARRISRLSSALMTTHPIGAQKLETWVRDNIRVEVHPAFSNVGEPDTNPTWANRDCAVLFGGQAEKANIYAHSNQLQELFARQQIEHLVDIGPSPKSVPSFEVSHDVLGVQPADVVSRWLRQARLGVVHRRLDIMTKSGLLAAYLAHGVPLLVLPNGEASQPPVLEEGSHYLTMSRARSSAIDGKHMSKCGYSWYQEHHHSRKQARTIHQMIRTVCKGTFDSE